MYHPRSSPYGDVYTIPTSGIDNIAKMVYREQQVREQQKQQQDKALDDEFAKNVAGVKSADIPEITSAYNDFKQAHIALQKKGNKATPQDQMDVMLKKANAFQAINASKEDKARLAGYAATVKNDSKGIYDPNATQMVNTWLNTPTSKRNFDEDANLKYKYAMPNIDKEIKNAAGNGQEKEIQVGIDPSDPLKDKSEIYKTINPPNTFYNNLFTGLASRSDNKGFIRTTMDSLTDEEKDKLRTAYEAKIADPKFKALYGDVQPFPASAANTELGQATALKTMEAFVNLPIDKVKDKSVINADRAATRKRTEGMEDWRTKNKITFGQSMAKIAANKAAGIPSEDTGYLSDNVADEFGEMQTIRFKGDSSSKKVIYVDKVDPKRLDIIIGRDLSKKQIGVKPLPIKQPDGSVRMGYYQDLGTGDWEGANGQKISRERVKDDYIKTVSPTKFKVQAGTKASENTKGNNAGYTNITETNRGQIGIKNGKWYDIKTGKEIK